MRYRNVMPELEGATKWYNSTAIKKNDLIGNQPTLFHFWSVSCELCKNQMSDINRLRDEYDRKLNVIAVHMPRSEQDLDLGIVKSIAREYDISHPIYVDNEHTLTGAFNNYYVPAYYVFDNNGKLRFFHAGRGGIKMLKNRLERVMFQL